MRGKAMLSRPQKIYGRITPAYAGKSCASHFVKCSRRDHPRLCGEKHKRNLGGSADLGSPPPMRGKANDDVDPPERIRITPAYAGKRQTANF